MVRIGLFAGVAALAMAWSVASARAAGSIQTQTPVAPTIDKTMELKVSGTANEADRPYAKLFVRPGGAGCAATWQGEDASNTNWESSHLDTGPFEQTWLWNPSATGPHLACAYLVSDNTDATLARHQREFTIRGSTATLRIEAPARVRPLRRFDVVLTGTSELPRQAFVTHKKAGPGRTCAATFGEERRVAKWSEELEDFADGSYRIVDPFPQGMERGTWLYCAYLQRSNDSAQADATAQATIEVSGPLLELRPLGGTQKARRNASNQRVAKFRVRNIGNAGARKAKACATVPKGFKPARARGATVRKRRVCWSFDLEAGKSRTFTVRARTPGRRGRQDVRLSLTAPGLSTARTKAPVRVR